MRNDAVIAFGQQPCGFFPRRYLVAKIRTARRLQESLGGRIVFFYHDSDHDPDETCTLLRNLRNGKVDRVNFRFENKVQKKYSPLYAKRITADWKSTIERQLPKYMERPSAEAFSSADADNPADFCLQVYRGLGLLEDIEVVRSCDPECRRRAVAVDDYFADVAYKGETVRARVNRDGRLRLHRGGNRYYELPPAEVKPEQISPARDTRLRWMQSIIGCTHYVAGAGERAYLNMEETPEITFVNRDEIERDQEAYTYVETHNQNSCVRSPSGRR